MKTTKQENNSLAESEDPLWQEESVRRWLWSADEDCLPESGEYYQKLHDKIMARVERKSQHRKNKKQSSVATECFHI
jgi:hypothetical protein